MAWQFDRPDLGEGMLLVLRWVHNTNKQLQVFFLGLEQAASYELHSLDDDLATEYSGNELLVSRVNIAVDEQPGSALIVYKRCA